MGAAPRFAKLLLCVGAIWMLMACAGGPEPFRMPVLVHGDFLAQAEAALASAADAGAAELAPVALREARRRIATARTVLLRAATDGRELSEGERVTVQRLAAEAVLDARLALARTQAAAVAVKIADIQAQLTAATTPPSAPAATSPAPAAPQPAPAASETKP